MKQGAGQLGSGGIRLFRVWGITVFLHWSWIIVAAIEIQRRQKEYASLAWNVAEYLTLFGIVLLHEFGHALACRSVGGTAERILLWPLGGVAYVNPPLRAGAMLWSIAAGPLVNVVLLPVFFGASSLLSAGVSRDLHVFARNIAYMNAFLLAFNLLPIYPLDGGQIVQSLLWFVIGRGRSLMTAAAMGFVGIAGGIYFAIISGDWWLVALAALAGMQSWAALQRGRLIRRIEVLPRHDIARCPACGAAPPAAPLWRCNCGQPFDPFAQGGMCAICGERATCAGCSSCGQTSPLVAWFPRPAPVTAAPAALPGLPSTPAPAATVM